MAKVKLENVYKVYEGGVRAVNDFNLDIPDKEFFIYVETFFVVLRIVSSIDILIERFVG